MKVLCLGAYSNGNIGDMYQADALGYALKLVDPSVEVFSLSPSKRASGYPLQATKPVSVDKLYDRAVLNGFDLILVGGGGLFASPHYPLADPAWVELLATTVCTVGVGVAAKHALEAQPFIEACTLFSVRDEYSLRGVQGIRPDARIVMDPILLAPDGFCPTATKVEGGGIVWVPGKLVGETANFYSQIHLNIMDHRRDRIISFNEVTDRTSGFDDVFGSQVDYLSSAEEFMEICADARFVVSERYHGCIFAMRAGARCLGAALRSAVVTSKITELYRRLSLTDAIITMDSKWTRSALRARAELQSPDGTTADIRRRRSDYMAYLKDCLEAARATGKVKRSVKA